MADCPLDTAYHCCISCSVSKETGQLLCLKPVLLWTGISRGLKQAHDCRSTTAILIGTLQSIRVSSIQSTVTGTDTTDHGIDPVIVSLCIGKPFQHKGTGPFTNHRAISCAIKGATLAGG